MSAKDIALDHHASRFGAYGVEWSIAEDDLVTILHHEVRENTDGAAYDFFVFRTYRIMADEIVEEWSNDAFGSDAPGSGKPGERTGTEPRDGDPVANKRRVADLYRCVFDAQNADAVKDFVTEDYHQHSPHLPSGRDGLEQFVRTAFPNGPVETPAEASVAPTILMGEGDLAVIAAGIPQPDGSGGTYIRYLYDGYRLRDGFLSEHWSGIDPHNRLQMP